MTKGRRPMGELYHGSTFRPTFEALDAGDAVLDEQERIEDEHRVSSLHFDLDDDER